MLATKLLPFGWQQIQTHIVPRLRVLRRRPFRYPLRTTDIVITHRRCVIGLYRHTITLVGRTVHI